MSLDLIDAVRERMQHIKIRLEHTPEEVECKRCETVPCDGLGMWWEDVEPLGHCPCTCHPEMPEWRARGLLVRPTILNVVEEASRKLKQMVRSVGGA